MTTTSPWAPQTGPAPQIHADPAPPQLPAPPQGGPPPVALRRRRISLLHCIVGGEVTGHSGSRRPVLSS